MSKPVKNRNLQKGHTNNPHGRPKGSLNSRTQDLFDIAQRNNCNPFEVLIWFAKGDFEALGYEHHQIKVTKDGTTVTELTISPELRQKSAKDACEYLFPKRKAVEHTFENPEKLDTEDVIEQTKEILKSIGAI